MMGKLRYEFQFCCKIRIIFIFELTNKLYSEHRHKKMEFMDMNEYCLEHVLKFCDVDPLVAVSHTSKKLYKIAAPLFKNKTSYKCSIESGEDEYRVKRTISSIGIHLTQLQLHGMHSPQIELDGVFFNRLTENCPNLQKLEIDCCAAQNVIFNSVCKLPKLEHLNIKIDKRWTRFRLESVNARLAIGLARALKKLQSFEMLGPEWPKQTIFKFIIEAEKLQRFGCTFGTGPIIRFEANKNFYEKFKLSRDPKEFFKQYTHFVRNMLG